MEQHEAEETKKEGFAKVSALFAQKLSLGKYLFYSICVVSAVTLLGFILAVIVCALPLAALILIINMSCNGGAIDFAPKEPEAEIKEVKKPRRSGIIDIPDEIFSKKPDSTFFAALTDTVGASFSNQKERK